MDSWSGSGLSIRDRRTLTVSRSVPECARFREQAAQIAVALFADTAKLLLPPARALPRHEPDLGREIPRRAERLRISDAGNQSRGQRRTNTRNLIEPPARLAGSVPSIAELGAECGRHARATSDTRLSLPDTRRPARGISVVILAKAGV